MNDTNGLLSNLLGEQLPEVPISITPRTALLIYGGFFLTFLAALIVWKSVNR